MTEQDKITEQTFFKLPRVKISSDRVLKTRLLTLISAKGISQADFYKSIGLSRQYWFSISYGLIECPLDLKVKISQALGVDSSVIWQEKKEEKNVV